MNFDLTDEHRVLERAVREWGAREVAPRIRDLDRQHRFDPALLSQMAGLGLLGVSIPAEHGGTGTDYISLGLASEELEYVDTSLRVILSVHVGLNSLTLLSWGTEDQYRNVTDTSIIEPAVDQQRYSYLVEVGIPPVYADLRLAGVRIDYSYRGHP